MWRGEQLLSTVVVHGVERGCVGCGDASGEPHASSPGLNGSPIVDCSGESSCYIYTVNKRAGINHDIELLRTRQIWKALFEDSKFQIATLEVDTPVTSAVAAAGGRNTLFILVCERSAASQIDWSKVDVRVSRPDAATLHRADHRVPWTVGAALCDRFRNDRNPAVACARRTSVLICQFVRQWPCDVTEDPDLTVPGDRCPGPVESC
jgi:hypothetical protein